MSLDYFLELTANEWRNGYCSNAISQAFLEMFSDLGLVQTIEEPTHQHGNILDVLLTNSPQTLSNISVGDENSVCKSDHFPINFNISANVRRTRPVKREIYNFQKADWAKLNLELSKIPWHSLLSDNSAEVCWQNFKTILHNACDSHIPTIKVRDGFKPPWFDSDVFEQCREKERLRIRLKVIKKRHREENMGIDNPTPSHILLDAEVKFQASRREVRRLIGNSHGGTIPPRTPPGSAWVRAGPRRTPAESAKFNFAAEQKIPPRNPPRTRRTAAEQICSAADPIGSAADWRNFRRRNALKRVRASPPQGYSESVRRGLLKNFVFSELFRD